MSEASNDRRRPRSLSAETKWEIFLQITAGEITHAGAGRKWRVDVFPRASSASEDASSCRR
jgi:hypothetical protein